MLVDVDSLLLTPVDVFGRSAGAWIVDRHHGHHPAARRWYAEDVLSLGFTSHYEHMWELFRPTALGSAGENVIVTCDAIVTAPEVAGGLRIESERGHVALSEAQAMEPCVEFTRFMTSRPDASPYDVAADPERLRHGVRGFAVGFAGPDPAEISVGDVMFVRAALPWPPSAGTPVGTSRMGFR